MSAFGRDEARELIEEHGAARVLHSVRLALETLAPFYKAHGGPEALDAVGDTMARLDHAVARMKPYETKKNVVAQTRENLLAAAQAMIEVPIGDAKGRVAAEAHVLDWARQLARFEKAR